MAQGKPSVASMESVTVHCSRENPAWLTYAASGDVAVCMKTDRVECVPNGSILL